MDWTTRKIKVPRQELSTRSFDYTPQRPGAKPGVQTNVVFRATSEDGSVEYTKCDAWGDMEGAKARIAQLTEIMESGQPVEVQIRFLDERNRWDIRLPRGSREAGFRQRSGWSGGGGSTWKQGSYRGKPVSMERYREITVENLDYFTKKIAALPAVKAIAESHPVEYARLIADIGQDLVAQVWISTKENVVFPPDCEPSAEPVSAAPASGGGNGATASVAETPATALEREIAAMSSVDAYEAIKEKIKSAQIPDDAQIGLFSRLYEKRKALSKAAQPTA